MPAKKPSLSARAVAIELLAASSGPRKVKELIAEALADPRSRKMKGKNARGHGRGPALHHGEERQAGHDARRHGGA